MLESFKQKLITFKKKTVTLNELEKMMSDHTTNYTDFAKKILTLEENGILQMIKSKGRNQRTPSIAYQYRINKGLLNKDYHRQLQTYRLQFHNAIDLDDYFTLDPSILERDLPYLKKINAYLEKNGLPTDAVPAPERSFELVGDEKWIVEKRGSDVLHRIKLWGKMRMFPVADPLMFAIKPNLYTTTNHFHLIVENKTTYQALLPVLTETQFSTLIYGCGNKITKSIENFSSQFPVAGDHHFLYFGDLDYSGITIWHSLNKREEVLLAIPFYRACLHKEKVYGKTNQRPNEQALTTFLPAFNENEQAQIRNLFSKGAYYPQEVLKTKEVQQIWLTTDWDEVVFNK